MSELREKADLLDRILKEQGAGKYTYTLSEGEKQELNLENGGFKLMRTVFSNSGSIRIFDGAKMGSASGNDLTEEGLRHLAEDAAAAAASSPEDPYHDIAPDQGKELFRQGSWEPDLDKFLERIQEFLDTAARDYPKVRIMSAIGSFDRWNWLSRNTNGTEFEGIGGQYHFSVEISAAEGDQTTGLDYTGFATKDLDTPFMELGAMKEHMSDIQRSIGAQAMDGKFEGTVILKPELAAEFIAMTLSNYTSSSVIIDGTSLWLNRVGEQVASEKLTVALKPYDSRIVNGERGTGDGFRSEDVTVIDHGVLKTHLLNLYAANKTQRPVVKNTGFDLVVEPGDTALADLIASVDKGLLMGGFSGGQPGTNGEFSGVAKNSFLIEKGKITRAVTETMVNGNLGEAFNRVRGISRELCCDGSSVVPYIAVDGIVISGK